MIKSDRNAALYLDDIQVGLCFKSATYTVEEKEIMDFAKQFDPQPFHTDPQTARDTIFGGLIASGWHTAAMTMRLLLSAFPIAGGNIGLGGEAAWPKPTRSGDIIHIEGEVIKIQPSQSHDDRGIITIRVETKNQREEVVQILTAKLLVFRRRHIPKRD